MVSLSHVVLCIDAALFIAIDTTEAAPKRREKKEAFKIDFLTPSDKSIKDIAKELFAPVTKGAGITLPNSNTTSRRGKGRKGKEREREDKRFDNTLPDDMHFSSRQLVTLFLKPKFSVRTQDKTKAGPLTYSSVCRMVNVAEDARTACTSRRPG